MSNRLRKVLAVGAVVILGVVAGCSGTSSTSSSASASASASESATMVGGNVLPPIMVDGQKTVAAKVGNTIVISTAGVTKVATDRPEMLQVSQPHTDGSATFNGGAKVITTGEGDLIAYGANDKVLYVVRVSATQ